MRSSIARLSVMRRAAVKLIDDLEDDLLGLLRRRVRHEQSSDAHVRVGAPVLRNERVRSFLHPVEDEPVAPAERSTNSWLTASHGSA